MSSFLKLSNLLLTSTLCYYLSFYSSMIWSLLSLGKFSTGYTRNSFYWSTTWNAPLIIHILLLSLSKIEKYLGVVIASTPLFSCIYIIKSIHRFLALNIFYSLISAVSVASVTLVNSWNRLSIRLNYFLNNFRFS